MTTDQQTRATVWPDQIYEVLKNAGVTQVAYVPDAGHAKLINRCFRKLYTEMGVSPKF